MPKLKKAKKAKKTDTAPKKRKRRSKEEKEEVIVASKKLLSKRHKAFKKEVGIKIVTASKVKTYFKEIGIRASSDMVESVADEVYSMLKKAVLRSIKNGRKTVRPWDL